MAKALASSWSETLCNATTIRKASRRITQFYDDALEPCGIRSTQLAILAELVRAASAPPTMTELAATLVMDRSALGHNLRPLLRDGLIELKDCAQDRRRTYVALTPLGKAKSREGSKLWQRAQDRFETSIGKSKAAGLRKTLLNIAHTDRLNSR